jgi:sugar phosphate isomerase/epimerase
MNYTRRSFMKLSAATASVFTIGSSSSFAVTPDPSNKSYYKGVQLGVQTYSFHEIPNDGKGHADEIVRDMLAVGAYDCELFSGPLVTDMWTGERPNPAVCPEPLRGCAPGMGGTLRNPWAWVFARVPEDEVPATRERQRKFLTETPDSYYEEFRLHFDKAGINIHSYNPYIHRVGGDPATGEGMSMEECEGLFRSCEALRLKYLNLSTTLDTIKQLYPFAEKYRVMLCPHGHSVTWDPQEFSTTKTFEEAFKLGPWIGANLDIGHFSAVGEDPCVFIEKYHERISNLHLKDRQRNQPGVKVETGNNVPWGQGDTPIKETLKFLQAKKYRVPAFVEYEYAGTSDPVEETKKNFRMCKQMLDS